MAEFFTRPNFDNRQIVQRVGDSITLSGTTTIANPGYLKINEGAAPGLVATSLDFDGTVIWGPVSGLSWSISACTSPLYVNNIVACPSSAGTIIVQSGVLAVNGALQLNTVFSGGTASDRLLVVDSNGFVKVGQTGTSISSLNYSNNNLILTLNDGSIFTTTINTMTGLTVNGNLTVSGNTSIVGNLNVTGNTYVSGSVSATTFYGNGSNLTGIPDYYVTGGTFTSNILTLNRQNGFVTIAGFTGFTDNYVTGGTYNYGTGTLTLNRQNGSVNINGIQFTGNTLASCINDIYVQNLYGCSNPITIQSSLKSSAGGSTATGTLAFAFGNNVTAAGNYSMAQGNGTSTVGGTYAHAEGFNTLASGQGSHAEGMGSIASGNYSHAQGLFTNATTDGTFASGSGSTASGANSFVHSVGSTVSGNRSVVLGGFGINGTANDFVYVPSLNINTAPANNNSNTQILSRNSGTGNVEYTDSSFLTIDTFVTGFTFTNDNTLTIGRNQGLPPLPVTINNLTLTGLTVNGSISATTYLNLPPFTGNTSASCITDLYVSNIYGCSLITIHDSVQSVGSSATGITSFAFGNTTVAAGDYSHAEGDGTEANGDASHAEGYRSIANGDYSHAEGNSTADGDYSHAEGSSNAIGDYSHAEGNSTADGDASHSEGGATQAKGNYSHAEGISTIAEGEGSHAEGNLTYAVNFYSHAEGDSTTADGSASHAEGKGTGAVGNYSHAEGEGTQTNGEASHAEGYVCIADGNYSHAEGRSTYTLGVASHAEGTGTQAIGDYSHAEGENTQATGIGSHAEGISSQSSGDYSHAEGGDTFSGAYAYLVSGYSGSNIVLNPSYGNITSAFISSTVFIYDSSSELSQVLDFSATSYNNITSATTVVVSGTGLTIVPYYILPNPRETGNYTPLNADQIFGLYSHSEGNGTQAIGNISHSEGEITQAIGYASHAEGYNTQANGVTSHAEGNRTTANDYSHAEGLFSKALGIYSHAEGLSSLSSGAGSHAQNFSTVASGQFSHAEGHSSRATGFTSHAEGFFTVAGGSHSHSEGEYTIARGITSHAEGSGTTASGNYSHAEGRFTIASGNTSHAEGLSTQAIGTGSHSQGISTTSSGIYSFASGSASTASGIASFVHSSRSVVTGDRSVVLGGQGISGTSSDFVYVSNLNINNQPTLNNSGTQILTRNSSTGNIEYRDASTISGGTSIDTFTTGFTYSNNNLTISRNQGQPPLNVTIDNFTGLTVNGSLSATTYLGLPQFVTGGTYSAGTLSLLTNYGNSVNLNITGFSTTDTYVTGFTYNNSNKLTLSQNQGQPDLNIYINVMSGLTINGSLAQGVGTTASGTGSHAEGKSTIASNQHSHAEGTDTQAIGANSHAEGSDSFSIGQSSHAEGFFTRAIGNYSHSEGISTSATTTGSHSQGNKTIASGLYSFASGSGSTASGDASFVHSNDSTVSGDRSVVLGGQGINGTQSDFVYVPSLNIDTIPVNDDTNTKVLVRNTSTGNVETKTFGLDNIVLTVAPPAIPIAGVGRPVDAINGIPKGQAISGYTSIYVNNVLQAGPVVTTNFGTYNNTNGIFTTNVGATLMLNAWIHLKPDTSSTLPWSLSGTGEFGLGICPNNDTDIYVGNYQTIIPDPDTAQYVYELYGANAPRTNQIDISINNIVYLNSGATFTLKVLNKTDRNYAGSPTVGGDAIRFSITRIM
jgi:hypothetical protein